ncbi:O-fucosyltransferase 20-like [Bidens hawaiensis]|uniref:O-fucosyltransferase 20-like n=1 Tax=Bidens hawaiensis TaxID=980011 RepID=UPI004049AE01
MAIQKTLINKKHPHCYISVPSEIINSLSSNSIQSLADTPKKTAAVAKINNYNNIIISKLKLIKNPRFYSTLILICGLFFILKMVNFPYPCGKNSIYQGLTSSLVKIDESKSQIYGNESQNDGFWEQPDGLGYKPCLDFSNEYRKASVEIMKNRSKYLVVVVSGGMNQQRNQIVDAVVIARILGATLVVPILQVNVIWGDESVSSVFPPCGRCYCANAKIDQIQSKEAEANKVAAKYDNASIDFRIDFYKKEGLTLYTSAKLPIRSGDINQKNHSSIRFSLGIDEIRDQKLSSASMSEQTKIALDDDG